MDQPLALRQQPERETVKTDSVHQMLEGVALARRMEQLAIALDNALSQEASALSEAEAEHKQRTAKADALRASILADIRQQFSTVGIDPPTGLGSASNSSTSTAVNSLKSELPVIAGKVYSLRRDIVEHGQKTKSTGQILWIITGVATVVLACGLHWGALICLVIPFAFYLFSQSVKSDMQSKIEQFLRDFQGKSQALDQGSAYNLNLERQAANDARAAAAQAIEVVFHKEKQTLIRELDNLELKLRQVVATLDAGIVQGSWSDPSWANWKPATSAPACLRLGSLFPPMPRYQANFPNNPHIQLPALVNYQSGKGIVIDATRGLEEAHRLAQGVVLRLLATVPPAGVRFTFIDPVSLGRNVAGFMPLEKYEPTLVGGKAWSDQQHIDRALTEITEHMETVIQKYLREDYKTIEDYNERARVKEAYRIVMVFDFPVNFSDNSAKRLASIMRNGPQCGVFPVVIVDSSKPLPYGFNINDLEQFATVFRYPGSTPIAPKTGEVSGNPENHLNDENDDHWDDEDDDDE
jgi:hypothetical protein